MWGWGWGSHGKGSRAVGLHAAVVEAQRVGDEPRRVVLLDRDLGAESRVRVVDGIAARIDRDFGKVLGRRALQAHVPPRFHRVYRRWQGPPARRGVGSPPPDGV